jgi:hypothetical protein
MLATCYYLNSLSPLSSIGYGGTIFLKSFFFFFLDRVINPFFIKRKGQKKGQKRFSNLHNIDKIRLFHARWQDSSVQDQTEMSISKLDQEFSCYNYKSNIKDYTSVKFAT